MRQALRYGLDRQAFVAAALQGFIVPGGAFSNRVRYDTAWLDR